MINIRQIFLMLLCLQTTTVFSNDLTAEELEKKSTTELESLYKEKKIQYQQAQDITSENSKYMENLKQQLLELEKKCDNELNVLSGIPSKPKSCKKMEEVFQVFKQRHEKMKQAVHKENKIGNELILILKCLDKRID